MTGRSLRFAPAPDQPHEATGAQQLVDNHGADIRRPPHVSLRDDRVGDVGSAASERSWPSDVTVYLVRNVYRTAFIDHAMATAFGTAILATVAALVFVSPVGSQPVPSLAALAVAGGAIVGAAALSAPEQWREGFPRINLFGGRMRQLRRCRASIVQIAGAGSFDCALEQAPHQRGPCRHKPDISSIVSGAAESARHIRLMREHEAPASPLDRLRKRWIDQRLVFIEAVGRLPEPFSRNRTRTGSAATFSRSTGQPA